MACPGSIRLSEQVPVPATTPAAEEGTRAHAVAELALASGNDPEAYVGDEIEGAIVTEDMTDALRVYVNHCREIMARPGVRYWIERKFSLASLKPPEPMFGTSDFCAFEPAIATLHVSDLKFGAGVLVEVIDSKQLRYYALGALLSLQEELGSDLFVENIRMTIVQPRMGHSDGVVRSEEISIIDLLAFATELLDAARKTQDPAAPLVAGSHCRFCPASGVCPEQRDFAQSLAQIEFGVVEAEPDVLPAPSIMPIEMVVEMLPKMEQLEDWIKACRAHVRARLEAGLEVPGYKLVATRATRKWNDTAAVEAIIAANPNLLDPSEAFEPREVRSPAQIEKILKKKLFGEKLGHLVEKKSSGHKMVPASDPSPALVISRGEEFLALPSGSEE